MNGKKGPSVVSQKAIDPERLSLKAALKKSDLNLGNDESSMSQSLTGKIF